MPGWFDGDPTLVHQQDEVVLVCYRILAWRPQGYSLRPKLFDNYVGNQVSGKSMQLFSNCAIAVHFHEPVVRPLGGRVH